MQPVWVKLETVLRVHEASIAVHGGGSGIRDQGLLESAIQRPQNLWHYSSSKPDVVALAAVLAHGVVKNHPFVDGNKRTAWVLCRLLLKLNGCDLVADQADKSDAMLRLAAGECSETEFADWLRKHLT